MDERYHAALFVVLTITTCPENIVDIFWSQSQSKNTSQNLKTRPRIQKCFGFWEVFWILGTVFGFWDVFWILGNILDSWNCFWILGRVLDSRKCFWILGSVLDSGMFLQADSGTCFGFWQVFLNSRKCLDSGMCFGFGNVFCPQTSQRKFE